MNSIQNNSVMWFQRRRISVVAILADTLCKEAIISSAFTGIEISARILCPSFEHICFKKGIDQ